jgi:NAD(P)-dependent dehydrogenase (short-subunit alcohol dehydrogenase family)
MAGLLDGHIAAVTGGGSGIGQGICQATGPKGQRISSGLAPSLGLRQNLASQSAAEAA